MKDHLRVLAVHAHPDDVEFQCAGTLVLLREAGHFVTIATMTPGDCGSAVQGKEKKRKRKNMSDTIPQKAHGPARPVGSCPSELMHEVRTDTHSTHDVLYQMTGEYVPVVPFPQAVADHIVLG